MNRKTISFSTRPYHPNSQTNSIPFSSIFWRLGLNITLILFFCQNIFRYQFHILLSWFQSRILSFVCFANAVAQRQVIWHKVPLCLTRLIAILIIPSIFVVFEFVSSYKFIFNKGPSIYYVSHGFSQTQPPTPTCKNL